MFDWSKASNVFFYLFLTATLALLASCGEEEQRFVDVTGPLDVGDPIGDAVDPVPEQFGTESYTLVHKFSVNARTTLVQHTVGWIEVSCIDPPPAREIGRLDVEFWEYWKINRNGMVWDDHHTDASTLLQEMNAAATAIQAADAEANIDLKCECYQADQVSIETLFEGDVVRHGGNVIFLHDGEYKALAAPSGSTPDGHWSFPDAQQPNTNHEGENQLENAPTAEVEIDASKWWTTTERATFYLGNCDDELENSFPEGTVGYTYHESGG